MRLMIVHDLSGLKFTGLLDAELDLAYPRGIASPGRLPNEQESAPATNRMDSSPLVRSDRHRGNDCSILTSFSISFGLPRQCLSTSFPCQSMISSPTFTNSQ